MQMIENKGWGSRGIWIAIYLKEKEGTERVLNKRRLKKADFKAEKWGIRALKPAALPDRQKSSVNEALLNNFPLLMLDGKPFCLSACLSSRVKASLTIQTQFYFQSTEKI